MRQLPFAPSLAMMRSILDGAAVSTGKHLARTLIAGDRSLSVPLAGGSAQLKHRDVDIFAVLISDHGRWRQEHLGALNAAYGKTPYFSHIYHSIEHIYEKNSHGSIGEFNLALFDFIVDFLEIDALKPAIAAMRTENPMRFAQLKSELETKVNLNYSIFDALFRLGKETALLISN